MVPDAILVLDFGGQYCHLIGRRVRDNNVYSEVVPCDITPEQIKGMKNLNVKGIILSGGPASIYEKGSPQMNKAVLDAGIPILGICYGHQLIAHYVKGRVEPAKKKEFGLSTANIEYADDLLKGLDRQEQVWMSHGDTVLALPKGYQVLASTSNCPIASFAQKERSIYGIQWHPEVVHTKNGMQVLRNFIFGVCRCEANWNVEDLASKQIAEIKKVVGNGRAMVALSGGIDSSTTAALAAKAVGKSLTAVFVDTGLMREGEPEQVRDAFKGFNINFISVDARERFLKRLEGVRDPEQKRRIIGDEFIKVFEEQAKKIKADYLLQGTIYPDRIESGITKSSSTIKTHHNVGGLPEKIKFKALVEPLKELYKDEVRKMALELGLPEALVYRQPFPGPGLAIRIVGEITREKVSIIQRADAIVREGMGGSKLNNSLWQCFAVLTDTKSTGVKGDARSYGYVVAIRGVESQEAMTANFAKIPYEILESISTRITNEIPEVVRVVYDITNKPPATIEWE